MWLNIFWIVLGLLFLIAVMAFVMNPPEAWLKRAFGVKGPEKKGPPPRN